MQVFLESVETPEGDMLVSGQQAAQERRFQAIWNELEQRMKEREKVQGEWPKLAHCVCGEMYAMSPSKRQREYLLRL